MQPLGTVRAELPDPVVVHAEARAAQFIIVEPEQWHPERRVDHLGLHAVDILILDSFRRVPAARARRLVALLQMLLQFFAALADAEAARDRERAHAGCDKEIAFTALALDYFRRPVAKFVVEPRLPEIGGLHHVGGGGNNTHVHWESLLISEGCQSVQVFLMRCIAPPTIEGKADRFSDRGR